MLNIIKNNQSYLKNNQYEETKRTTSYKHFPRASREWKNSVYLYNKNNLHLIPSSDSTAINIIKSYFSLFNKEIENNARTKRITLKYRKPSTHKIYVGNAELEHTNNTVTINLYLFNRQINNYHIAMRWLKPEYLKNFQYYKRFISYKLDDVINFTLNTLREKKLFLLRNLKKNNLNKIINEYTNIYIDNFLFKHLNKEFNKKLLYWCYIQLVFINRSKFTYLYLQYLKEQIYQIYNKQVEFNLINLKKFYFSSDILTEIITKRISKKRKKVFIYIKKLKNKVKILNKNTYIHKFITKRLNEKKNLSSFANKSSSSLMKIIMKNLKYKDVTGFKLEARGRLTKRFTASRSILKVISKGNLFNIDSSLKGLSSVMLKGNLNANTQYSKLASKSRTGSFGIKSWISSD